MGTNAVNKKPQYSDLPEGANIVHDPASGVSYSDIPQGATVVNPVDTTTKSNWGWYEPMRGVLSRMGDAVKGIPHFLNPVATQEDFEQGVPLSSPVPGMPNIMPVNRLIHGQIEAEKQLGPQLADQFKAAELSHKPNPQDSLLQRFWKAGPSLEDARVGVTGLSMLNPFASGSVANVNALNASGQGDKASQQGIADAAMLGLSFGTDPALQGAMKVLPKVASTAKVLGTPAVKMGLEAAQDVPIVRGIMKGAKTFKDVPGQLSDIWKSPTPIQDAVSGANSSATLHDIPNFRVNSAPSAPVNLLDKPAAPVTGFQGEFPVEASPTPIQDAFQSDPSLFKPRSISGRTVTPRPATADNLIQPGSEGTRNYDAMPIRPSIEQQAAQGDWIAQGMLRDRAIAAERAKMQTPDFSQTEVAPVNTSFFNPDSAAMQRLAQRGDAQLAMQAKPELDMSKFYGKFSGKSNLVKNLKQLARY